MNNAAKMVLIMLGMVCSCAAKPETAHTCENSEIMLVCSRCGELKEIRCLIEGEPWCEECLKKSIDGGTDNA